VDPERLRFERDLAVDAFPDEPFRDEARVRPLLRLLPERARLADDAACLLDDRPRCGDFWLLWAILTLLESFYSTLSALLGKCVPSGGRANPHGGIVPW